MSKIYLCPNCSSEAMEVSALVGGSARCLACTWTGTQAQAIQREVEMGVSPENLEAMFVKELRNLISGHLATPLLPFLVRWGFLDADTVTAEQAARILQGISAAILETLIEQRTAFEVERAKKVQEQPS